MKKGVVGIIAWVLVIIGALNWGLIGAFDFNLVSAIFKEGSIALQVVYIIVGISALIAIFYKSKK